MGSGSLGKGKPFPSLDEAGLDLYTGKEGYLMQTPKQEQRYWWPRKHSLM